MPMSLTCDAAICTKCGKEYSRRKGYFAVSYAVQHKGIGHVPVCKACIDQMFDAYMARCNDPKVCVRLMCRKLDVYWSEKVYEIVSLKSAVNTMMTQYLAKISSVSFANKSYDDTLEEEGTLWTFAANPALTASQVKEEEAKPEEKPDKPEELEPEVPEDVKIFWGSGYTPSMYHELEQRRSYWMSRLGAGNDIDVGTEALIRQICSLELDINRDRAAGKAVDKSVTALNALLGSANLKPVQKKSDDENSSFDTTPFGVWIKRWEDQRPIPDPDPELEDKDGLVRYLDIWFKGHLAKMLGLKNAYSKSYEKAISKIKVERPEYEDDDDETVFEEVFDKGDPYEEPD